MKITESNKTAAKNAVSEFLLAFGKVVFKGGLIITGFSTYALQWTETPYGMFPIIQAFGTLNVIVALAWEYANQVNAKR